MIYSYTQISQYLTCPRRYRHRYLDGWREKDTRAAMLFGRAFESALAAFFRREDSSAVLFREWSAFKQQDLQYSKYDSWDRMLQQGIQLLERFCQEDRIRIRQPQRNLQVKFVLPIGGHNEFVAYIDAIGELDGQHCLLEWKTTSSRYPEEPQGLLALDPQLVFLDEPTSGLDPIGAGEFDELIKTLQRTLGLTVYMVTHDLDSLHAICDRIAVLASGKVILTGTMQEMLASEHPWLKAYFRGKRARMAVA